MEKLEVGQVWKSDANARRILDIANDGDIKYYTYGEYWWASGCNFRLWLKRTGAKAKGK